MSALANALARGVTILTPNQRAARAITRAFNAGQRDPLWTPPTVLPLETWLASLWTERILNGQTTRILLNRTQEHFLWREIIAADPETPRLQSADALAELAARAWSLVCRYNARPRLREFTPSTDSRAFERWSRLFERRLARAQYITTAELPGEVATLPSLAQTAVALVDFDTHPPAISALFATLQAQGVAFETIRTTVEPVASSLHIAADDREELTAAAVWLRDLCATHPGAQIAVVVPNLEDRRAEIERIFAPILTPNTLPITAVPAAPVYEFSLGRVLGDLPIAQTAVDLLTWTMEPLPLERISALLLSRWFAAADPEAAEFDAFHLRQTHLLRPELSLEATIKLLDKRRPSTNPDKTDNSPLNHSQLIDRAVEPPPRTHLPSANYRLHPELPLAAAINVPDKPRPSTNPDKTDNSPLNHSQLIDRAAEPQPRTHLSSANYLRALHQAARKAQLTPRPGQSEPHTQTHAEWADDFRALLTAAGWTRNAHTDSLAFQQHRRWESALDELATLDFEQSQTTAGQALDKLRNILAQTVFAPESTNAPIQIIGALEVAGTAFDALWFLGADDLAWPAPAASNPLLPWQLQRTLGMPGADRVRDDAAAHALTSRIARAARQVVFSFAQRSDEGERRSSPLLGSLRLQALAELSLPPPRSPQPLETLPDEVGLPGLPEGPVKGGAQILKLQAACAFRAFAEQRLWSTEPESRQSGLDARERGSLVHKVMELFWSEVKTQANLRSMPELQRAELLTRVIAEAFVRIRPQTTWDDAYLRVQQRRLLSLLMPWIEVEAVRPAFEVQPVEQKKHFQLGPLTLDLRIDRIDTTAHGDLILDYKTGLAAPAQWLTDRPDEPQLPLYAVLTRQAGRDVAGVAFVLLRPGDGLDLKGFADAEDVFGKTAPMNAPSLAEQIEDWQLTLTHLADAYADGDTRVAPKDYPNTCNYCAQRILCRLNPELLDADLDPNPNQASDMEGDSLDG